MKKEFIEALQWLLGEGWSVYYQEVANAFVITAPPSPSLATDPPWRDVWHSDNPSDNLELCHLIDEALLKLEDVIFITHKRWPHTSEYVIRLQSSRCLIALGDDPLTARLEALVKLKESLIVIVDGGLK